MSRPAVKPIRERIVPCPTCGAEQFRPCNAHTEAEIERAMGTNVWKVPPHTARRKAERAERERRASIIDTIEKAQTLPVDSLLHDVNGKTVVVIAGATGNGNDFVYVRTGQRRAVKYVEPYFPLTLLFRPEES